MIKHLIKYFLNFSYRFFKRPLNTLPYKADTKLLFCKTGSNTYEIGDDCITYYDLTNKTPCFEIRRLSYWAIFEDYATFDNGDILDNIYIEKSVHCEIQYKDFENKTHLETIKCENRINCLSHKDFGFFLLDVESFIGNKDSENKLVNIRFTFNSKGFYDFTSDDEYLDFLSMKEKIIKKEVDTKPLFKNEIK